MQRGFTYLWILIAIAITSAGLAASVSVYSAAVARNKLIELQWVLQQYQTAFESYRGASPIGQSPSPQTLEELLDDKRYVTIRRHIRELYEDPMTGQLDWQLDLTTSGRIAGVSSRAQR
jgi:type II secretory pathway pseudopilin PulG